MVAFPFLAAVASLAFGVAACSSGGDGGGGNDTVPANATVIKAIEGISWDAKTYTATSVGGKVTISLKDESSLPHNLHLVGSDDVDIGVSLDVQGRGDTHTEQVTLAPGTYQVICTIAGHGNMKATLTVS
jgi:plastocyanin